MKKFLCQKLNSEDLGFVREYPADLRSPGNKIICQPQELGTPHNILEELGICGETDDKGHKVPNGRLHFIVKPS